METGKTIVMFLWCEAEAHQNRKNWPCAFGFHHDALDINIVGTIRKNPYMQVYKELK